MVKLAKIIILIFLLGNCSAGRDYQRVVGAWLSRDLVTTGEDYRSVLDSWIGYDINLLLRRWGNPTETFDTEKHWEYDVPWSENEQEEVVMKPIKSKNEEVQVVNQTPEPAWKKIKRVIL